MTDNWLIHIYRITVAISTLLYIALWTIPYFDYNWLTREELNLLSSNGFNAIITTSELFFWLLFATWLVVSIGLFFFNFAARIAFIALIAASTIASLFWGYSVFTPYEAAISNVVSLCDGAIIVMSYFTSVRDRFSDASNQVSATDH